MSMQNPDANTYAIIMETPITGFNGKLGVRIENDCVCRIDFLTPQTKSKLTVSAYTKSVESELHAYFDDPTYQFSIPVKLEGTAFRERVWSLLKTIPSGETRCYGEMAKTLHSSARAVGGACRHNPVPFIIPCHRVIAQTGFGGYSGETDGWKMAIKRWLLAHENKGNDPRFHC